VNIRIYCRVSYSVSGLFDTSWRCYCCCSCYWHAAASQQQPDAVYCYRCLDVAWSVSLCICLCGCLCVARCKNGWTDRYAGESRRPREPRIRWRCTLAPPDEYDWTIRVQRRCGLVLSNYCCDLSSERLAGSGPFIGISGVTVSTRLAD